MKKKEEDVIFHVTVDGARYQEENLKMKSFDPHAGFDHELDAEKLFDFLGHLPQGTWRALYSRMEKEHKDRP